MTPRSSLRRVLLCAGFVAAGMALSALPARAQEPAAFVAPANLSLSFGVNGSAVRTDVQNAATESGRGLSFALGWNFGPRFSLFADITGAAITAVDGGDDYSLGHFDLGARYAFEAPTRRWAPYLDAAVSGRAAVWSNVTDPASGVTDDLSMSGTGFTLGGGLQYHFARSVALNTNFRWTAGEFDTVKFGGQSSTTSNGQKATSTRFNLGLTWYPMAH